MGDTVKYIFLKQTYHGGHGKTFRPGDPVPGDIPGAAIDGLLEDGTIGEKVTVIPPEVTDEPEPAEQVFYETMTVLELNKIMREAGIPVTGNKAEKIEALEMADKVDSE